MIINPSVRGICLVSIRGFSNRLVSAIGTAQATMIHIRNLFVQAEISGDPNVASVDPLESQLGNLDAEAYTPFGTWERQMFGENIHPLQYQVTAGLFEPPQVSGVGMMFRDSLTSQYAKWSRKLYEDRTTNTFLFNFMGRITNLYQAARQAVNMGNVLFYVPQNTANVTITSPYSTPPVNAPAAGKQS